MNFQDQLTELYNRIKQMKLKNCITVDKDTNTTNSAKIIKKSITKRTFGENEIVFKMDDFMSWSIHENNINEIIITSDLIKLFESENTMVCFTK